MNNQIYAHQTTARTTGATQVQGLLVSNTGNAEASLAGAPIQTPARGSIDWAFDWPFNRDKASKWVLRVCWCVLTLALPRPAETQVKERVLLKGWHRRGHGISRSNALQMLFAFWATAIVGKHCTVCSMLDAWRSIAVPSSHSRLFTAFTNHPMPHRAPEATAKDGVAHETPDTCADGPITFTVCSMPLFAC